MSEERGWPTVNLNSNDDFWDRLDEVDERRRLHESRFELSDERDEERLAALDDRAVDFAAIEREEAEADAAERRRRREVAVIRRKVCNMSTSEYDWCMWSTRNEICSKYMIDLEGAERLRRAARVVAGVPNFPSWITETHKSEIVDMEPAEIASLFEVTVEFAEKMRKLYKRELEEERRHGCEAV